MADDLIQRLAGCWDLVDAHFTTSESITTEPWGPSPTGMFVMTGRGEFSAHVMRTKRSKFVSEHPTPEEKQQAYHDCLGYFGEVIGVDSSAGTFTSRVLGATNENWVGGEQLRYFEMRDNDYVVLRSPPLAYAGVELVGTLAWARRSRVLLGGPSNEGLQPRGRRSFRGSGGGCKSRSDVS